MSCGEAEFTRPPEREGERNPVPSGDQRLGSGEVGGVEAVKYLVTEGNLSLGGERTVQYTYDVFLNCTLETHTILLPSVTLIKKIKKGPQSWGHVGRFGAWGWGAKARAPSDVL